MKWNDDAGVINDRRGWGWGGEAEMQSIDGWVLKCCSIPAEHVECVIILNM